LDLFKQILSILDIRNIVGALVIVPINSCHLIFYRQVSIDYLNDFTISGITIASSCKTSTSESSVLGVQQQGTLYF
jgi:hypothetical protein